MRIGLQTWGSEGDVNPFLALAAGLAAAGHEVTLAVTCGERVDYAEAGARQGFAVRSAGFIGRDEEELARIARELFATANVVRQMRLLHERMFEPGVDRLFETARELCAANDLVIGHHVLHPLRAAAELAGRPAASVALSPGAVPSRELPPFPAPNLGPWANALAWRIGGLVLDRIVLPSANRLRRRLGLAPLRSYRETWEAKGCSLVAVSPPLCPPPRDWAGRHTMCGFLRAPAADPGAGLPPGLERFLAAGSPPVYLTFGSMIATVRSRQHVEEAARLLVGAARAAGRRAIVQAPWDLAGGSAAEGEVFRVGKVPHLAIFPRCELVVHHGGAGTTYAATLSGRPSVIVPHVLDQYFWGRLLRRLGAAPAMIDRRRANPRNLGRAIRLALGRPALAERARALGARLAAEDGVGTAVRTLERSFGVGRQGAR